MKDDETQKQQAGELESLMARDDLVLRTDDGRNLAAVLLGRQGGLKGGRARAERLSPEKRREIAQRAAKVRWGSRNG